MGIGKRIASLFRKEKKTEKELPQEVITEPQRMTPAPPTPKPLVPEPPPSPFFPKKPSSLGGGSGSSSTPVIVSSGSTDTAKTKEQGQIAKEIRAEAKTKGIDLSTRARELGFLRAREKARDNFIPEKKKTIYFERDLGSTITPIKEKPPRSEIILTQKPQNTVTLPKKQSGFFESINSVLTTTQTKLQTKGERGQIKTKERVLLYGVSTISTVNDQIIGVKNLFGSVKSPKNFAQNIYNIPSSIKEQFGEIGSGFKSKTPETSLGTITGLYLGSKTVETSIQSIPKISDYIRTSKTTRLPKEDIIAPEYFKGETFPLLRKGETAGQLLKEFQTPTELKGFTASPKPFAKITTAGVGSSELPGVYQAPKLSPNFLRITQSEKKLFSLNPFQTFRPSATIIKPVSYELPSYLKYSTKNIQPLPKAKSFFINKAELGKAYIPFIKTEKEAVIPAGTGLKQINKRFSFKFEGRIIPIYEFEVSKIDDINLKKTKIYSTQEISSISSRRIGNKAVFKSTDVLKVSYSKAYIKPKINIYSSNNYNKSSQTSIIKSSYNINTSSYFKQPSRNNIKSSIPKISKKPSYSMLVSKYSPRYITPSPISSVPPFTPRKINKSTISESSYFSNKQIRNKFISSNRFVVSIRRFGKFKPIGVTKTQRQAFSLGIFSTRTTLGATFKVEGRVKQPKNIFGYRTKKTKQGLLFIEEPRFRLSTPTETKEIQYFKGLKGGYRF